MRHKYIKYTNIKQMAQCILRLSHSLVGHKLNSRSFSITTSYPFKDNCLDHWIYVHDSVASLCILHTWIHTVCSLCVYIFMHVCLLGSTVIYFLFCMLYQEKFRACSWFCAQAVWYTVNLNLVETEPCSAVCKGIILLAELPLWPTAHFWQSSVFWISLLYNK